MKDISHRLLILVTLNLFQGLKFAVFKKDNEE